MAQKYGFFNSSGGDRVYDATDFASYFGNLVSNGMFTKTADNLRVTAASGMTVTVQPGSAWIDGYCYENTSDLSLALETANGVNPRIDRVVLRWSAIDRNILLAVKTGAATASPSAPALTRTSDIYELGIADIAVGRGVLSIASSDITDTRLNSSLCGTVNSLLRAVYE
jgi:hypothetical protein